MRLWPFKKTVSRELDEDSFDRWLRAQRPPFEWFLALPEEEQEALAQRGDAYVEDVAGLYGFAAADPFGSTLALAAERGDEDAEAALAMRNAERAAAARQTPQIGPRGPRLSTPSSFAGVGKRRQAAEAAREVAQERPTLFGKAADA